MPRARFAIAHFDSTEAAHAMRRALIAQGATGIEIRADAVAVGADGCRLEVMLPPTIERRLLEILLSSEASRVEVHDRDS